jgi:hypothetical protein
MDHRTSQPRGSCPNMQIVKKYVCVIQPALVMTLLCVWMFTSISGMVEEVKQISTKDRLERKKYIGTCRWESEINLFRTNISKWEISKK